MSEETIIIDPVGMNIVNRIAPGSKFVGEFESVGGLLIEGTFVGNVLVSEGPLVLMEHGTITGNVTCEDDAYLFGKIHPKDGEEHSELIAGGAVFMAQTLEARTNITAGAIKTYDGAQVDGRIRTVRKSKTKRSDSGNSDGT